MNKKIIAVLLMIVCLGSIAGGVYSTINAQDYKKEYETKTKYEETYTKLAENSVNSKFNLTFFSDQMMDKAEDFKIEADLAKSQLTKFAVLAGVMYFVALMMLVSFVVILNRIKKAPQQAKEPKKRRKSKKKNEITDEEE